MPLVINSLGGRHTCTHTHTHTHTQTCIPIFADKAILRKHGQAHAGQHLEKTHPFQYMRHYPLLYAK